MFNWWTIEKFNLSRLKTVYIIFITFPTASMFSCLKIEHRKKNFHFVPLFLIPSVPIRRWYFTIFKTSWNGQYHVFLQATWDSTFLYHITGSGKRKKWATLVANHHNFSRNWQGGGGGDEGLKSECESPQVLWGLLPQSAWIKSAYFLFLGWVYLRINLYCFLIPETQEYSHVKK